MPNEMQRLEARLAQIAATLASIDRRLAQAERDAAPCPLGEPDIRTAAQLAPASGRG